MFAWQATVQDEAGNIVPLPVVTVYLDDGETMADIYDDVGGALPNPLTGTMEGFVQFWAGAGRYKIDGASGGDATEVWEWDAGFSDQPYINRAAAVAAIGGVPDDILSVRWVSTGGRILGVSRDPGASYIPDMPGWVPAGCVTLKHFTDAWAVDCGPGLRAARDYVESLGGGTIWIDGRDNVLATGEDRMVWISGSVESGMVSLPSGVYLPLGVSIKGEGRDITRLACTLTRGSIIGLLDYGHGEVSGFELVGAGATGNTTHGIMTVVSSSDYWTIHDVRIERMKIRDVGSYGIGHQYCGMVGVTVRDMIIHDTGSDGIDWKVRSELGQETEDESIVFDNIEVRRFGLRITGGSSTGLGIRGRAQLNNINVYEVTAGQVAISLLPSSNDEDRQDKRKGAFFSSINNWYVEAANPRLDPQPVAVRVFSTDRCLVGQGVAKWCSVEDAKSGPSPARALFGPIFNGVVITPGHGSYAAAEIGSNGTVADMVVLSDYDRFGVRTGTATVGQTVFNLPWGPPTAGYSVVKNEQVLTEGFSVSGSVLTMDDPIGAGDDIQVVYPPERAVRVTGLHACIRGYADKFIPIGANAASQTVQDTMDASGFYAAGRDRLMISAITAALRVQGSAENIPAIITAKGTGSVRLQNSATGGDVFRARGSGPNGLETVSGEFPSLTAFGDGADVETRISSKGNAPVAFYTNGRRTFQLSSPSANAVNFLRLHSGESASPVQLAISGDDDDVDIWVRPKGAGRVRIGTRVATADAPVTGYIEIKDAGGTIRKLAVID